MRRFALIVVLMALGVSFATAQEHKTLREWGFPTGIFETGKYNAITDVPGVTVGDVTLIEGDSVRTGVTAIMPVWRTSCRTSLGSSTWSKVMT